MSNKLVGNGDNSGTGPLLELVIDSQGVIKLSCQLPPVEVEKLLQNVCTAVRYQHIEKMLASKKDPLIVPGHLGMGITH